MKNQLELNIPKKLTILGRTINIKIVPGDKPLYDPIEKQKETHGYIYHSKNLIVVKNDEEILNTLFHEISHFLSRMTNLIVGVEKDIHIWSMILEDIFKGIFYKEVLKSQTKTKTRKTKKN